MNVPGWVSFFLDSTVGRDTSGKKKKKKRTPTYRDGQNAPVENSSVRGRRKANKKKAKKD